MKQDTTTYLVYLESTPVTDYKVQGGEIILLCNSLLEETLTVKELYEIQSTLNTENPAYRLESGEEIFLHTVDHINGKVIFKTQQFTATQRVSKKDTVKVGLFQDNLYYKNLKGWCTSNTLY